jgi:hypothetical protein
VDRREATLRTNAQAAGPTVQERQQALIHFYQEYEALVETVCDSAQYGPTATLNKAYQLQREWMLENYPTIRRYVVAYLRYEVEDQGDPFEALFSADDLNTFLQSDDGNMISRIMRTREALNLYGDHLRQLAAAA